MCLSGWELPCSSCLLLSGGRGGSIIIIQDASGVVEFFEATQCTVCGRALTSFPNVTWLQLNQRCQTEPKLVKEFESARNSVLNGVKAWLARSVSKYEVDEVRVIEVFWHWTLKEWEDDFEVSPKWLAIQVVHLQKWGDSVLARPEPTDPPYSRRRVELTYSQLVELFEPILEAKGAAPGAESAVAVGHALQLPAGIGPAGPCRF